MTQTTTTLPITITIEVSGTFVPGNLHRVRDEEPQGDTFEDLELRKLTIGDPDESAPTLASLTISLIQDILATHRDEIIEALLTARSNELD